MLLFLELAEIGVIHFVHILPSSCLSYISPNPFPRLNLFSIKATHLEEDARLSLTDLLQRLQSAADVAFNAVRGRRKVFWG